jgi:leader peptidase (prepilin peptidase)/N-methyltransferase
VNADAMARAVTWLAMATAASAVAFAASRSLVAGATALPAAMALAGTALTDVHRHRIATRWVDTAAAATIVVLAVRGLADRTFDHLVVGLAASAVTWVVWWTIRVASGNGLGYGDVRVATLAALPLGGLWWTTALLLTPVVFLAAAVFLLPLRSTARGGRIPLAPAMAVAWGVVLCLAAVAAGPGGDAG